MRFCILLIISILLCGCTHYAPPGENHQVRVVTRIDVLTNTEASTQKHSYTDNEKMEVILYYLRNLQPDKATPITPDTFRSDSYEICLTMSDGSQTIYRQIYDEYLQKNGGRWHSIDRALGGILPKVLDGMSSDGL